MENDGRDPNTTENGDPIWYIKMSDEERKAFDDYYAKEKGLKRNRNQPVATVSNPTESIPTYKPGENYQVPTYRGNW